MGRLSNYILNLAISFDQFCNTLIGGYPDETLSSVCYRHRNDNKLRKFFYNFVNCLFFWQRNPSHCERAYNSEIERNHLKKS